MKRFFKKPHGLLSVVFFCLSGNILCIYLYLYLLYIYIGWLANYVFGSKSTNNKVSLEEKLHLVEKVKDCKLKYDAELESLNAYCHWDAKGKGLVPDTFN